MGIHVKHYNTFFEQFFLFKKNKIQCITHAFRPHDMMVSIYEGVERSADPRKGADVPHRGLSVSQQLLPWLQVLWSMSPSYDCIFLLFLVIKMDYQSPFLCFYTLLCFCSPDKGLGLGKNTREQRQRCINFLFKWVLCPIYPLYIRVFWILIIPYINAAVDLIYLASSQQRNRFYCLCGKMMMLTKCWFTHNEINYWVH